MSDKSTDLTNYADRAMFGAEPMESLIPKVHLLSATPDPLGSIAAMSKMYKGEVVRSLDELTDEERQHFWDESFKTHLKAPWESVDFHFMIEGVTRAFTHQMVRQRTAVFAQESLRFAVKEDIAARPGVLVQSDPQAKERWEEAVDQVWGAYQALIAMGVPAEEARGLLPHDTLTRLHYKTNLRNLADHLGNRLCTQAQFEWRIVAAGLKNAIGNYDPQTAKHHSWQFKRIADSTIFRPVCFELGHCPFTAEFDRGCTIRDRVEEGRFEDIEDREWAMDPTAGWVR